MSEETKVPEPLLYAIKEFFSDTSHLPEYSIEIDNITQDALCNLADNHGGDYCGDYFIFMRAFKTLLTKLKVYVDEK